VVRTRRSRSSRTCLLLLWPSYVLGRPAVRAYCCAIVHARWSSRTRLLLLRPSYVLSRAAVRAYCAIVHARWSCCVRPLLTIDRPSETPAWESGWYPGEAPGESGGSWLNSFSFPLLTFLGGCTLSPMSMVFPVGVFTRLRVLTRHPRTLGFTVISLFSQSFSPALPYE